MRDIKVFFGYQFSNSKINRIDREASYSAILDNVNKNFTNEVGCKLSWNYWHLKSNEYLGSQILTSINKADILIFDLSEPNTNVYFELGYAIALSKNTAKQVVLILHEEVDFFKIGSDLSGLFVLTINEDNIIQKLGKEIKNAIEIYMKNSWLDITKEFWGIEEQNEIHIVCPEIPNDLRVSFADSEDSNYLRYSKFADIDSLIYLKVNLKALNTKLKISDYTAIEYHQSNQSKLIVGGPAWNRLAKEYQKVLPTKFVDGGDGNDDPLTISHNGIVKSYQPVEENGILLSDVSMFARINSKSKEKVFLLSGCRTLGVLGASKIFLESSSAAKNISKVMNDVGDNDFVLIFKTIPYYGTVSSIELNENNIYALFKRDEINNEFIKVY